MASEMPASKPLVTVCIITLNRERVISEALRSLISQSYPKDRLYVVVVDGGSTDRTVKICRDLLSTAGFSGYEIVVQPSTIPEARNICISRVRGDFAFFWDSDVIMQPCALERLVGSAIETRADIISASVSFLAVRNAEEGWRELDKMQCDAAGGVVEVPAVTMSATLIRKETLEKVRFDPDLTLYEDLDFCWRARALGFRVFLDEGVRAIDLNLTSDPGVDVFIGKPLSELMKGLRKKGKAKALCLDLKPGLRPFIIYLIRNPRHAFYLGYVPTLFLLAYAIVQHNLSLASVTAGYILGYAALQVAKRGLNLGVKVLAASLLVGLPMNIFMLYYSALSSFSRLFERLRGQSSLNR
ncbi:MAG: glycosyltransferase [Thermofilum sp.]